MGLRHHSLQMTEVADVRDMLEAFEEHNGVKLEMRLELVSKQNGPDIVIAGLAHQAGVPIGEAPPLASVSVTCSGMNLKHLAGALTHVMYALDFQLALNEMDPKRNASA